ncbi:hypothetical protein [Erwinia pyrifoliae]|uniref:hypothetical protein n=1 Tax=Erwinia pyrifoliae TaxID=79967 RepID=UPI0022033600|nr:hypothetical protein [Erwinia pyrifoliae]UWS28906.1 hypothetical protein NYP81_13345 [Erwinia pyrifoliae]
MQQAIIVAFFIIWLGISAGVSILYTSGTGWLLLVWPLILSMPFLLRPLGWLERQFRPNLSLISRRKGRAYVHLSPWQPTVRLSAQQIRAFWSSVNRSTCEALQKNRTVIVSSHLLTTNRATRLKAHLAESGRHFRCRAFSVPFTPAARAVMQLEILFRQWRWRSPARKVWPVMVIRKKSSGTGSST